jgi:hypothetical protein
MTVNDLESTDVVAPAYLPPRLFLWRRHRLVHDRQAGTVAWSTLGDTKVFAVPGSPAGGSLPTLASIVVVDSMVTTPMSPAMPSKPVLRQIAGLRAGGRAIVTVVKLVVLGHA